MFICMCHPFSDKKVKEHLSSNGGRATVSGTYKSCSGGNNPNCCQCLETLKDMVKSHNSAVGA